MNIAILKKEPKGYGCDNFAGYFFFDKKHNHVGGAASTMHKNRLAKKKANELNKPILVFLAKHGLWHYQEEVKPN
jgi:hypothetical protein